MGLYGSAPSSPNPQETAAAQTATNVATATANSYLGNINQVTPDGNLTYSYGESRDIYDPTTGRTYTVPTTTVTTTLSDQQRAIKDQEDAASLNLATLANSQSSRLNGLLGTPFSLDGAPAAGNVSSLNAPSYTQYGSGPQLQTGLEDTGSITRSYDVADVSNYQQAMLDRMQPTLSANRSALEQKLANQGLQPGSAAFDRAMATATRQENDAVLGSILNAGNYQATLANTQNQLASFQNAAQNQAHSQALSSANLANSANQQMHQNQNTATSANNALADQSFNAQRSLIDAQNAARAQYLNEQYAARNQPINEITALMNGAQVTAPNFVSTQGQSLPNIDYAGLVQQNYQNQLAAYNQRQAGIGSLLGGFGSLAMQLSDRNAKKDVEKVGGLYAYRYKGEGTDAPKRIGVMAQEVEKVRPDVVRKGADGLRRVNYGALFNAGGQV